MFEGQKLGDKLSGVGRYSFRSGEPIGWNEFRGCMNHGFGINVLVQHAYFWNGMQHGLCAEKRKGEKVRYELCENGTRLLTFTET